MGQSDRGGVTVPPHAHDPLGPHIRHLASALRVRTPHSVEALATDGATLTMHAHRSLARLAYSYTAFCGNPRRERTPPLELGS